MTSAAVKKRSAIRLILSSLVTLPVVVLGVGFVFHTSFDGRVLGKYSPSYALFLALWFLAIIPAAFLLGRFLFGTQYIVLNSGRKIPVKPIAKILAVAVAVSLLVGPADRKITREIRRASTTGADQFHPYLQNAPKPHREQVHANRWGFRGDAIKKKKPADTYRIFMLGGSTVFCGRLPYEVTHAAMLQEHLRQAHPEVNIEVQNAGGDWHTSQHSLIKLLFHIQDFDPDLVIIYHGVNDLCRSFSPDLFAEGSYWPDYRHFFGAASYMARPEQTRWALVQMKLGYWFSDFRFERVRVRVAPWRDGPAEETMFLPKAREVTVETWPSLKAFRRNMTDFVQTVRSKNIDVVMASQPFLYRDDLSDTEREVIWVPLSHQQDGTKASIPSMIEGMSLFNAASRSIAERFGVEFVDLEAIVPKSLTHFTDDVHYTREGCLLIADAFRRRIVEAQLVERRLRARADGG